MARKDSVMKGKKHGQEQIIRKLREAEKLKSEGLSIGQIGQRLEVSEQTYHRWKNRFGGMNVDQAKEVRRLKDENSRLKKVVAEQMLDIDILKTAMQGKS